MPRGNVANIAMIGCCAGNPSGVNQDTIAGLQIRSILVELKGEGFSGRDAPRSTNRAESLYAKFETAVIEEIGHLLIRMPSFTLHEARETPEIFQLCRPAGGGT